jgi:hypothetical protein
MTSTNPSPANSANTAQAIRATAIRGLIISLVLNGAIPFLIYWTLTSHTTISQFVALVISSIPSVIGSIVGVIRRKQIDFLGGIVLSGIAISLIVIALGGNPKILLIRESFFTGAFGLAFLVSLLLPRPLMFYISRHFISGNDPANVAHVNLFWQYESFRRSMRVMSAVWGIGLLLEAVIRISLVVTLNVTQFLAISPFVIDGIIALLIIWTFSYSRTGRQRSAELMQRVAAEEQMNPATSTSIEGS